jgi:hypothetical protein
VVLPQEVKEMLEMRLGHESMFEEEGRLTILEYYAGLIPTHPFGLGFNYEQRFVIDLSYEKARKLNSVLELWAYGGFGAVLSVGAILWLALRRFHSLARKKPVVSDRAHLWYVGAWVSLLALWGASLFTGALIMDLSHSLVLAMVMAGPPLEEKLAEKRYAESCKADSATGALYLVKGRSLV